MANKVVNKDVKTSKQKGRRLKRSVRKTLGALCLASAIAVAAIPTEGLQADEPRRDTHSVTISSNEKIPHFDKSANIYTTIDPVTKDPLFRFAFYNDSGNLLAVILGFNSQSLKDGSVVIPEQVEPYMKFTNSLGTSQGYVAVGGSGKFLYWKETKQVQVQVTGGDTQIQEQFVAYHPCYASDIDKWGNLEAKDLYFDKEHDSVAGSGRTDYQENDLTSTAQDPSAQRKPADVAYIGNQYVQDTSKDESNPSGIWEIGGDVTKDNPNKGVFAENNNIRTLEISDKLRGIGDYAFYRCGSLSSVSLANGLSYIAEGAFENCNNMTNINLVVQSNLTDIAQRAFFNCEALNTFTLPSGVQRIGDSAFEGCRALSMVDLLSDGTNNQLSELGRDVFKNCESLQSITFPRSVTGEVCLCIFKGCISLRYISTRNMTIHFKDEPGYFTYKNFKDMLAEGSGSPVDGAFYFQGMDGSDLHKLAKEKCFAFSYIQVLGDEVTDLNRYELTVQEVDKNGQKPDSDTEEYYAEGTATYEVNSSRHLTRYSAGDKVTSITIPSRIGPYPINVIDEETFKDRCRVKMVTIPANVREIGDRAFQGCHNLENVIFKSEAVAIGDNAFTTQTVGSHEFGCSGVENDVDNTPKVKLKFTGPVSESSGPFNYAMSARGKYNAEGQKEDFITYYTGWPTNMEIQYNPQTDMSELVNFPSLNELERTDVYTSKNYAYIDKEHEEATTTAVQKYRNNQEATMTDMEKAIIDAAVNIVIPEGVDSVRDGLFREKEIEDTSPMKLRAPKTVTAYSLKRITCAESADVSGGDTGKVTGTFAGCEQISSIALLGGVDTIEDHAFLNCKALEHVELPATVQSLGVRPFGGCTKLSAVSFDGGPYYTCENSIIYKLTDGAKTKIVECLEGRSNPRVSADETASVEELSPEAFMGTPVMSVDLSKSTVTAIPEKAFANTQALMEVTLPRYEPKRVEKDAFTDSTILSLVIPGERATIHPEAFAGSTKTGKDGLWFYCEPNSDAWIYAENYNINHEETKPERYWKVKFVYYDDEGAEHQIGDIQEILEGESATPPEPPQREGLVFLRWTPQDYLAVYRDTTVQANYVDEAEVTYTVRFLLEDGSVYSEQNVVRGHDVIMPQPPYKQGFVFLGWKVMGGDGSTNTSLINVLNDMDVMAVYRTAQAGEDDGSGTQSKSPSPGTSGSPAPGTSGSPSPGAGGSASPSPGTNGSASPSPGTNGSASPSPGTNGSASPSPGAGGSASPSPGAGQRPNGNVGTTNRGGTTVVIDKNGLSNTGVVSATVNGSSDDFVVKISESAEASEAALRALMAEYGEDITNIRYFPMDISLYDSTGTNKITDTTGLSVSITLPLPDSLVTYAGNNKAASVVDNQLERLAARFTTIQGVSCITFTAEHFSPYLIYVDLGDLSAGLVSDETPKTGDAIHPKWFLSIGLACVSLVLFMQKDTKKQPKKAKVKVRAR